MGRSQQYLDLPGTRGLHHRCPPTSPITPHLSADLAGSAPRRPAASSRPREGHPGEAGPGPRAPQGGLASLGRGTDQTTLWGADVSKGRRWGSRGGGARGLGGPRAGKFPCLYLRTVSQGLSSSPARGTLRCRLQDEQRTVPRPAHCAHRVFLEPGSGHCLRRTCWPLPERVFG